MNKKELSERDVCSKFINPALVGSGWDLRTQIREEVTFTDGRVIVQGSLHSRGKSKRADYILYFKANMPIAIIEAKDNKHNVGDGMQQALEYSEILDIPFVFTSNGDSFVFHDKTIQEGQIEKEISLEQFPTPAELRKKYNAYKNLDTLEAVEVAEQEYFTDDSGMSPRYYQQIAINRTVEAVAKGIDRILLVMATGTGKTYTAFNIIWRLWKSKKKQRILFLADRSALLTQTKNGDFSPFGSDIMHIIKNRKIDKSYQIYFALYQGLTSNDDSKNAYKEFSKDFFDLIIIDECHRGSASEASAWREVLDHFDKATQIGLTATPKETKDISNIAYFGEPIYTYSLKQGIEDGFLAPYKVVRISTDIDDGWRPTTGLRDKYGNEVEDRIYNLKDYDRTLSIDERTQVVAQKITEYLKATDRFAKTIVFCKDIDHANRMRIALINSNADLSSKYWNYCVKITGDDEIGKQELDNFTDVEERFPVIATTSKMLTTGIDTKMVKFIVLESNIGSMTEFKQIIGRGTRIRESEGKTFFTIMDFRKNTDKFADREFDGDPVQIYSPDYNESPVPPDLVESEQPNPYSQSSSPGGEKSNIDIDLTEAEVKKFYVNNVDVKVSSERVQYYGKDGKLITESLKQYTKDNIIKEYNTIEVFKNKWNSTTKKEELISAMAENGIFLEALKEEVGRDVDAFDLICHIAFDMPPLTRKERAENVKKRNYFSKYGDQAREVLEGLLEKYVQDGVTSIEDGSVLKLMPLSELGSPVELVKSFGKKSDYEDAVIELEREIYKRA